MAKKGPIQLARATGAPITAFYAAVEKKWVINSWDRFVIPKPFSRVLVRVVDGFLESLPGTGTAVVA